MLESLDKGIGVLCAQVLVAFMVGIHNLYWYYGSHYIMERQVAKSTAELFEKCARHTVLD